jgi:hypothetical protein
MPMKFVVQFVHPRIFLSPSPLSAIIFPEEPNIGQVVGTAGADPEDCTGYLWTDTSTSWTCPLLKTGTSQPISQVIPAEYQTEVSNIDPISISGTDANGAVRILFNARYQTDPNHDYGYGTFLLTLTSDSNPPVLQQVSLPSNVSFDFSPNVNAVMFGTSPESAGSASQNGSLNAQGLIAGVGCISSSDTTIRALLLLPAQVIVKTQGDPDPVPTFSSTNGILVQNGTTLDIRLNNIPQAQFPIPQNQIVWYSRQLMQSGTSWTDSNPDDYFTAWTALGSECTGVECTYSATTSGIFELKATLSYSGTSQDILYVRSCDATNGTDGEGDYPSALRQGAPDYFGVYDSPVQLAIRNNAHNGLGSTKYAENVRLTVPNGNSYPSPFTFLNSFTIGSTPPHNDKCNAFVYVSGTTAGASIPLIHGNYWYRLAEIYTSPPAAYDWYDFSVTIGDWDQVPFFDGPQPGFVVSRPDDSTWDPTNPRYSQNHGKPFAHVGILDYDGSWISAGGKTVNKYAHITDPDYQPILLRSYP